MKYKPNDIAKALGVTTNTIRRYEKLGYISPERDDSEYRWYQEGDLVHLANVFLYRKCGFSHAEITEMQESESHHVIEVCLEKLAEIDNELERLKRLRHWLKDNIKLMNTFEELRDNFTTMESREIKYVLFSNQDYIAKTQSELETINIFMYSSPEVQLIQLYRYEDIMNEIFNPYNGWALKTTDIPKFGLDTVLTDDNPNIKTYPARKCFYCTHEIPKKDFLNKSPDSSSINFLKKAIDCMKENNYKVGGDIMTNIVNTFSDKITMLIIIPIDES